MLLKALKCAGLALAAVVGIQSPALAENQPYSFNVLNHRSVALTAQYWNPILGYVSLKSGVRLELKMSKTSKENTARAEKGAFDFLYTNHFFTPERDRLGFQVIARPAGPGIRGQIIVRKDSPIRDLKELEGKHVAFPTPDGFTGYWVPMDALLRAGVHVIPRFSGDQEASIVLVARQEVAAAGVNSLVMERFARRKGFEYRALWTSSEIYHDLCIMATPKVPKEKVAAVKATFVNMVKDPKGRKILEAGAALLNVEDELGFVASDNSDYDDYRAFYKKTRVKASTKDQPNS
jgi:phosphonate transport system substrate-binding protein